MIYCHIVARRTGYGSLCCYRELGHEGDHYDLALRVWWRKNEGPGGDSEPAGDSPDPKAPGTARILSPTG